MKRHSYDSVAYYYEKLGFLLGRPYQDSKFDFLDRLQEGDQVLCLGGGTGVNLQRLLDGIGSDGTVHYLEASAKMILRAKRRVKPEQLSQVVFLHQSDFAEIPLHTYDVILTQFFLDILLDQEIHRLFQEVEERTALDVRWIFVDFFSAKGKTWLVNLMIFFFRWTTGHPRNDLPNYAHFFYSWDWEIKERKARQRGFIQAWLLMKDRNK